jgi:hypothetical protein
MQKNLFGVLSKTHEGFELYTYCSNINLSEELEYLWQTEKPIHIKVDSDRRTLLNESDCELYYDRDKDRNYKLHINDINIEDTLEHAIGEKLDITIVTESEEVTNESRYVRAS